MSHEPSPTFVQAPPAPGNQYSGDAFLRSYLRRVLNPAVLRDIEPELEQMGELAGGSLYELQLADRENLPRLLQWDAWGNRIDRIEVTRVWQNAAALAARSGLIGIPYERTHGAASRLHQFALVYLFHPSTDLYTCPLAMTDGAARSLLLSGSDELIARALPRLTHRDPAQAWTSGQWMTEAIGGSDVSQTLTRAVQDANGQWRLYGKKWFTSAITSEMALTLARPEGQGAGAQQLAMFYVETRDATGRLNGLRVERLKDKLGTRKLPTAELQLEGVLATPVRGLTNGTRNIEPMLVVTRTWNSVTAVSFMRRGIALARDYARKRRAFGALLIDQPLHVETLANLESEFRGAFLLAFELVRLLGQEEAGVLAEQDRDLLRLLTPLAKLLTAKQCVAAMSEVIECFGGAGYVEDTGIPMLLRDAQVLSIWEGTTNVLALDALLRAGAEAGAASMNLRIAGLLRRVSTPAIASALTLAGGVIHSAREWLAQVSDRKSAQSAAREWVMSVGRAFELTLLAEHALWQADHGEAEAGIAAVERFARTVQPMRPRTCGGERLL